MRDTPYYRDCVWEQFSAGEYKRRYDCFAPRCASTSSTRVIVPGGPSHWSFGAGMTWLTGHWEWHALCCYVLVPLDGEPTMIYSMGGTHAEAVAVHVEVAVKDVRHSRNGQYAQVMVERLPAAEARKRPHRPDGDRPAPRRLHAGQPVQHAAQGTAGRRTRVHEELLARPRGDPPKEELDCVRKAGVLCQNAMEAMVARAKPGVKEYELKAAAAAAIMDGGGDIDFLIIGSTPMDNPALIFGNPRPSGRVLKKGDMVNMELAAGYRGYTAQIGSPITLGPPTDMVRKFWEEITLPGYNKIVAEMLPGKKREHAGRQPVLPRQGRAVAADAVPRHRHRHRQSAHHLGPHRGDESDMVLKPGMIIMAEPNPITADGMFGIFLGHTFIITDTRPRVSTSSRWRSPWRSAD